MSLISGRDWVAFFGDAGIPSASAKTYGAWFVENRIKGDMLEDLDKGYLRDMGITAHGDIICILKHAKKVVNARKEEISLKDIKTEKNVKTEKDSETEKAIKTEKGKNPGPEVVKARLEKSRTPKIPKTKRPSSAQAQHSGLTTSLEFYILTKDFNFKRLLLIFCVLICVLCC